MSTSDTDDNRIRLDETPVDFSRTDQVDQLHSSYPDPNTQARFDQMKSFMIGLISNQSSPGECEPFEKRIGTLWFNKTIEMLLLFNGTDFDTISKYISVESSTTDEEDVTTTDVVTLQSLLDEVLATLELVGPEVVWSGFFSNDEVNEIPIPTEFQGYAALSGMQAFVHIDGLYKDPRKCIIDENNNTVIRLVGINTKPNQEFTVELRKITEIKLETVIAGAGA